MNPTELLAVRQLVGASLHDRAVHLPGELSVARATHMARAARWRPAVAALLRGAGQHLLEASRRLEPVGSADACPAPR